MVPSVSILCYCDSWKELMQMYITKRFSLLMPIWINLYIQFVTISDFNFNELIQWSTTNKRFKDSRRTLSVLLIMANCYQLLYWRFDIFAVQKSLDRRKIYISSHNCNTKAWVQVYEGLHPTLKSIIINS